MRECKYRAWDKKRKKMLPVVDLNWDFGDVKAFITVYDEDTDANDNVIGGYTLMPNEYVLMQYTGLKDKNGKEIYERDILKDTSENDVGEVVYHTCFYAFMYQGSKKRYYLGDIATTTIDGKCDNVEVIGNIYENKNLL